MRIEKIGLSSSEIFDKFRFLYVPVIIVNFIERKKQTTDAIFNNQIIMKRSAYCW
jgi:hypothetical protein